MPTTTEEQKAPETNQPETTKETPIAVQPEKKEVITAPEKKPEPIPKPNISHESLTAPWLESQGVNNGPSAIRPELNKNIPWEDRILAFLESRGSGFIKLNDFLKSLYPIPRLNEPPVYFQQHEGKKMRVLLGTMQASGKIILANNNYLNLGKTCQSEPKEGHAQPTFTHNLNTVIIEARKK